MGRSESIEVQMAELLDECSKEVRRAMSDAQDTVTKDAVRKLKSTSPKKTGDYAKGWTKKKTITSSGIPEVVVYNKTEYRLTHLLENGHVVRNKKGTYGRTNGKKHIAPVAEEARTEIVEEFYKEFNP